MDLFPQVCVFSKGLDLLEGLVLGPSVHDAVRDAVAASAARGGIALGAVKPVAFMVRGGSGMSGGGWGRR